MTNSERGGTYRTASLRGWATFHVPALGAAEAVVRGAPSPVEAAPQPLVLPPLLMQHRAYIEPLNVQTTSSEEAEAFIVPTELSLDVTSQTPLRIELTPPAAVLGDAFAVLPLASDGRFVYLAGRPARLQGGQAERRTGTPLRLDVTHLPDIDDLAPVDPGEDQMRFGLGRGIKLAFFKIVGIPTADVGLRVPTLEGGRVNYRPVEPGELETGKVALLVHGFLSDTGWMVNALLAGLRREGYDHIATWDYETCRTPIQQTAEELSRELQEAGVEAGSRALDIIAHSEGTLVSRALMVQTLESHLVGRALLMGAPNAGTPIANVADRVTNLVSTLLNLSVGPVSVGALVRFLWEALDAGLDDMQPGSNFIRSLNSNPEQQDTPLTLIVGDAAGDPLESLVKRIFKEAANVFYGGLNDLAVSVDSMNAVAAPPYPSVVAHQVNCNHFDYLRSDGQSRDVVERWIAIP